MLQENGGGLGELSHSDLTGLVSGLDEEEDIFKQLADSSFELEQFFDFNEEKVHFLYVWSKISLSVS